MFIPRYTKTRAPLRLTTKRSKVEAVKVEGSRLEEMRQKLNAQKPEIVDYIDTREVTKTRRNTKRVPPWMRVEPASMYCGCGLVFV